MRQLVIELTRYNSQTHALVVIHDSLVWDGGADVEIHVDDADSLAALVADINALREDGYHGCGVQDMAALRRDVIAAAPHTAGWDWTAEALGPGPGEQA